MKAIKIFSKEDLRLIDIEKPVIDKENNILVKIKAAGICGSDIGIYHGKNAAATYPRIIGHEMVGVVEEIGEDVKKLKIGDRVIIEQVVSCGHCYPCSIGRKNVCDNLKVRGVHIDGGYREYMSVPEDACHILPEDLDFCEAIMIEPTTIAIQSLSRAELTDKDTLLILGVGALGSSILKLASISNNNIIVADMIDEKLNEALTKGAKYAINIAKENLEEKVKEYTGGRGVTIAIDAACTSNSLIEAIKATGNAGRVITMGFSLENTTVNQFFITSREIDIRGSRLQNDKFKEAIELINSKKLDIKNTVSHKFHFTKAQEAFDLIDSKDSSVRKVALLFD